MINLNSDSNNEFISDPFADDTQKTEMIKNLNI